MLECITFKVIPVCYQDAKSLDAADADFLVESDDWNDYGYSTTYHLHASNKLTGDKTSYLGYIQIMKVGQTMNDSNLLGILFKENKGFFNSLPDNFVSLSFSLDLYRGVSKLLKSYEERKLFMDSLNMILDEDSPYYKMVKDEECFEKSLLRNATMNSFVLRKAKQMMLGDMVFYDLDERSMDVTYNNAQEIHIDFKCPDGVSGNEDVPYGMVAFIGHNGCGKSTFLYELAKWIYTVPTLRHRLSETIQVKPSDIGTTKLLMFSYSAFDNFLFPGITLSDYRLMAEGVESREGRFIYCGVRDVRQEMEQLIKKEIKRQNKGENPEEKERNIIVQDTRMEDVKIKPIKRLAAEFSEALLSINYDSAKCDAWYVMLERCEELVPSLYQDIKFFSRLRLDWKDENAERYLGMSTGVKFFLHIMSHIYAYNEDNSILLFDEPENHLHPPMLSFMMSEIRKVIRRTHSVMLVSTHSPVILQEMFTKNTFVIQRDGESFTFKHLLTETYGENFGYINRLVFGLNSDICNYHDVFDTIYRKYRCDDMDSIEDVIKLFCEKLECECLSSQMVAYLANKYEFKEEK